MNQGEFQFIQYNKLCDTTIRRQLQSVKFLVASFKFILDENKYYIH